MCAHTRTLHAHDTSTTKSQPLPSPPLVPSSSFRKLASSGDYKIQFPLSTGYWKCLYMDAHKCVCMQKTHSLNENSTKIGASLCWWMVNCSILKLQCMKPRCSSLPQLRQGHEVYEPLPRILSMTSCNENGKVCAAVWL